DLGSLRDGLSLLDRALAYTGAGEGKGCLDDAGVAAMLGTVDRTRIGALLDALADGNGKALLDEVATLAGFSPDWGGVLDALAESLHRIQVRQLVPEAAVEDGGIALDRLAQALRPELVQLWYQMALNGRRDLPLAPGARAGFEMVVLRMLAFRPADAGAGETSPGPAQPAARGGKGGVAAARAALAEAPAGGGRTRAAASRAESAPVAPAAPARIEPTPPPPTEPAASVLDHDGWIALVRDSDLAGPARQLAAHAVFVGHADGVLRLALPPEDALLKKSVRALENALAPALGGRVQVKFE